MRPVTSQVAAEIGYDPAGGTDPGPFTQQVAERLHAADPRWGRRINSTGPISDDTVAYRVGTSPVNPLSIDIVLAAHTTHARLQWHTYDHWAETPGAHPTISRHISVYPGISRILFFVRGHQGGGAAERPRGGRGAPGLLHPLQPVPGRLHAELVVPHNTNETAWQLERHTANRSGPAVLAVITGRDSGTAIGRCPGRGRRSRGP